MSGDYGCPHYRRTETECAAQICAYHRYALNTCASLPPSDIAVCYVRPKVSCDGNRERCEVKAAKAARKGGAE